MLSVFLKHSCSHVFDPSLCSRRNDTWTQTDDFGAIENVGLDEQPSARLLQVKLSNVRKKYRVLTERSVDGNRQDSTVEERMLRFQKECSERSKKEIKREVARFREREAMLIQQAERAKFHAELEKMKDACFREHQAKLKALREREGALEEQMALREQELRDKLYKDRQNLLGQMNALQETASKRSSEQKLWEKERQMEKERLKDHEREVAALRRKLETERQEFAQKCEHEIKTYKLAVAREYQERQQAMSEAESRLRDRTADFERKKETWDSSLATWRGASERYEQETQACQKLGEEVSTLRADLEHMRSQNQFLKESLENDRTRYDQLHENFVASAEKHARVEENVEKDLRALRLKNEDLRSSLELVRENADANERKLMAQIEQFQLEQKRRNIPNEASALSQLYRANDQVKALQQELEEKEHALAAAKKEVKELNALLFKARKAFTQISDAPPPAPTVTQANTEPSLYRAPQFAPQFLHPSFAYVMPQGFPPPVPPTLSEQKRTPEESTLARENEDNDVSAKKDLKDEMLSPPKEQEAELGEVPEKSEPEEAEQVSFQAPVVKAVAPDKKIDVGEEIASSTESSGYSDQVIASLSEGSLEELTREPKLPGETSERVNDGSPVREKISLEEVVCNKVASEEVVSHEMVENDKAVVLEESEKEVSAGITEGLSEKEIERRAAEALAHQRKSRDLQRSLLQEEIRKVEDQSRRAKELEEASVEGVSKEASQETDAVKEETIEVDPLIAQYRASAEQKLAEQKLAKVEELQTQSVTEASSLSDGEGT